MVIEGSAVFDALDHARHQARQDVEHGRAETGRIEAQVRELVASRSAALLALARHYLPDLDRAHVDQTFDGVRSEILAIVARKEGRRRELDDKLRTTRETAATQDAAIRQVTDHLNDLVARRTDLEAQVAATLAKDPEFTRLSQAAAEAEILLHRNEQRIEEIRAEAAAKRPAFERNSLFRYLYDRGYGTPDYQASGLIRRLDGWVARLIDFSRARGGYQFLIRTPGLVEEEVERRRKAFDTLMRQVEALQTRQSDAAGLSDVLREGLKIGAERDRLTAALAETRADIGRIEAERNSLETERDTFYQEALEKLRDYLDRMRSDVLERHAQRSPETEDDTLASQSNEMARSIAELNDRLADLGRQRQAAESVQSGLDRLTTRFRQENFDSDRSYFENLPDLNNLLVRYQRGEIREEALWDALRGAQRFRPIRVEPSPRAGHPWDAPHSTTTAPSSAGLPDIVFSPAGRVLIGAMGQALDAALRQAAWRGVQRRESSPPSWAPSWNPAPERTAPPPSPPPSAGSGGGFTSGEGF